MPNRILREGILTSERIATLSWPEEVFYRRLMSVVDDFGRYYASPKLLRAACYPLLIDKVSDADVGKWLAKCAEAALVSVYPASDGKSYLQLHDFKQQVRAKESKFPQAICTCSADASKCVAHAKQTIADAHLVVVVSEGGDVVGKRAAPEGSTLRVTDLVAEGVPEQFASSWLLVRKAKKAPLTQTAWDAVKREAELAGLTPAQAVQTSAENSWQGFKAEWMAGKSLNGTHPVKPKPEAPNLNQGELY